METFTPVLPKGRVGTTGSSEVSKLDLPAAFAKGPMEASTDPTPAAPVVFKKPLRDHFLSLFDILILSFHGFRISPVRL
jgi:hypothetical protein